MFQERRIVIGHKLDTQEALTKSNQVNMELQAQLDGLIEARDALEQEGVKLREKVKAFHTAVSSNELETSSRLVEIEALSRENRTLREVRVCLMFVLDV